jgi:hypothetical protein
VKHIGGNTANLGYLAPKELEAILVGPAEATAIYILQKLRVRSDRTLMPLSPFPIKIRSNPREHHCEH